MQKTLQQLQAQRNGVRRGMLVLIPLLLAAALVIFRSRWLAIVLTAAAAAWQLLYVQPHKKRYLDDFVQENIRRTLCVPLGSSGAQEKSGGALTADTLRGAALLPFDGGKGSVLLRQGLSGQKDGIAAALCDASLAEGLPGESRRHTHFCTGCWMHFALPQDTGRSWRMVDRELLPVPIRRAFYAGQPALQETAPADVALAEKFVFYLPEGTAPSRAVLRLLRQFADYTPGHIAVSLHGAELDVFLGGRFLARPVSFRQEPTEALLNFDPLPELGWGLRLAKAAAGAETALGAGQPEPDAPDTSDAAPAAPVQ